MAYTFNSESKVVSSKSEKFNSEGKPCPNLMHNKRVFRGHIHNVHNIRHILTPLEQEQQHIEQEKENKQIEMLKSQIESFKNNSMKLTPYDIRPGPSPRIPIDLQYFLTDHTPFRTDESNIFTQTDTFLKRIKKRYIPKKTGIDATTQIWDGDLFDFNQEAQPIVNILASKSLEEALQEVEEEQEIKRFFERQNQHKQLRDEIAYKESAILKEEYELITSTFTHMQNKREISAKKKGLFQKVLNLNTAKNYLAKLIPQTIGSMSQENVFLDYSKELINSTYKELIHDKAVQENNRKFAIGEFVEDLKNQIASKFIESNSKIVKKFKEKSRKAEITYINFSEEKRFVSFFYENSEFAPRSEFKNRLDYALNNEEYFPSEFDRSLLRDAPSESSPIPSPREPSEFTPRQFTSLLIQNMNSLKFSVSHNSILDTPAAERKYKLRWEVYSDTGELLGNTAGIKLIANPRELFSKITDDETLKINLRKIPQEVQHILLFVDTKDSEKEFKYAKFHLDHGLNSQIIHHSSLDDESILAYRVYKQDIDPRSLEVNEEKEVIMPEKDDSWMLDIYNIPIEIEDTYEFFSKLAADSSEYIHDFTQELIEYKTNKIIDYEIYEKKLKEMQEEAKNAKSSKNRKGKKLKPPEEPRPTNNFTPPAVIPNHTIGPFLVHKKTSLEELMEMAFQAADFIEGDKQLFVMNKEITKIDYVFRAKNLLQMKIAEKIPEEDEHSEEENSDIEMQ